MSENSGWPPWLVVAVAAMPGSAAFTLGPAVWKAWREWRGDKRTERTAAEKIEIDERAQLAAERAAVTARADAAFSRSDAEVARMAMVCADLRISLAAEVASGQRWYQVARAWWSRAWDKLSVARQWREDIIEAREGWCEDRRGWFREQPESAACARRPEWMGPPPDFRPVVPGPIPDPPGLEEILKP